MTDELSHHDAADHVHVRPYIFVFFALLIGTGLTVWAAQIHFGSRAMNIAIALIIASVKAFLVAGYFMHLISERKLIYGVLISTAFFFTGLMFLTIWAAHDMPVLRP
ncbi:MAG: cytochrome C oxidase subunit IV family protein [Verrucomicrobia bacterium]|nr:cytochrome C oxidase subunit IV family protein [Verrucomicrobiota bacterium]